MGCLPRSGLSVAAALLAGATVVGAAAGAGCNALTGVDEIQLASSTLPAGGAGHGGQGSSGGDGGHATSAGGVGGVGGVGAVGGVGGGTGDPCAGISCSGHGSCVPGAEQQPECQCEQGYHDVALECVVDETCAAVQCTGRCRTCHVIDGVAECVCPDGFAWTGSDCTPSPDPCDTVNCNDGFTCVSEHHCVAEALCMEICDCTNCGTCSMQDFANGNTQVLYCGSGQSPPATVTCADPCPAGYGCLPFSPGFCWPGQGCMSAP